MLKLIYRLILRLLRTLLLDIPLIILGIIILFPVLPVHFYHVKHDIKRSWKLPKLLKYFDCADLYGEFNRSAVTYLLFVIPKGWLFTYYWLAIRNPINYFNYKFYSIIPKKSILVNKLYIKTQQYTPPGTIVNIGDSTKDMAGLLSSEYLIDGKIYYEYYYVYKYNIKQLKGKCFRFRLGWKIGLPSEIKLDQVIQDVMNIQPTATYSGY